MINEFTKVLHKRKVFENKYITLNLSIVITPNDILLELEFLFDNTHPLAEVNFITAVKNSLGFVHSKDNTLVYLCKSNDTIRRKLRRVHDLCKEFNFNEFDDYFDATVKEIFGLL